MHEMNRSAWLSVASGFAWGLYGFAFVRDTSIPSAAWGGLIASPFIGLAMGRWAMSARPSGLVKRALFALLSLEGAVLLFAMAIAIWTVTVAWDAAPSLVQARGRSSHVVQTLIFFPMGMTLSGLMLVLWPIALANHLLIWRSQGRDGSHVSALGRS